MPTLRYIATSCIVLCLYLFPVLQSLSSIGIYLTNLEYITLQLCVNRDKPERHCDGTCMLAKMLTEEKAPLSDPFNNTENSIEQLQLIAFPQSLSKVPKKFICSKNFSLTAGNGLYGYLYSDVLDQPPEQVI